MYEMKLTAGQVRWVLDQEKILQEHDDAINNLQQTSNARANALLEIAKIVGYEGISNDKTLFSLKGDIFNDGRLYRLDELVEIIRNMDNITRQNE